MSEKSCPSRGTWIEMVLIINTGSWKPSRAPRGARGLKSHSLPWPAPCLCRAPRGARGLKLFARRMEFYRAAVVPLAGHVD